MKHAALILGGLTFLAACGGDPVPTDAVLPGRLPAGTLQAASAREQDLKTLRRVTAPFQNFAKADSAGWSAAITPCMQDPTLGGMGFHYGNVGLIDGSVQVDQPELLLYEPHDNGQLQLVAVEYIIPYTFVPRDAQAPTLFGEKFLQNDTFQLWGLHVWLWKRNPSGLFASWNPTVSCASATTVSTMHH
jgi:hypothetical protein